MRRLADLDHAARKTSNVQADAEASASALSPGRSHCPTVLASRQTQDQANSRAKEQASKERERQRYQQMVEALKAMSLRLAATERQRHGEASARLKAEQHARDARRSFVTVVLKLPAPPTPKRRPAKCFVGCGGEELLRSDPF